MAEFVVIVAGGVLAGALVVQAATSGSHPLATISPTADPVGTVLDAQSNSLLGGDEAGWLAPVIDSDTATVAGYRRIYDGLRALNVKSMHQRTANTPNEIGDIARDRNATEIVVDYCLATTGCPEPFEASFNVDIAIISGPRGASVRIDHLEIPPHPVPSDPAITALPWMVADLHGLSNGRVIVAATSAYASRLAATLPIAVRAAARADTLASWGKPPAYILYLASVAEFAEWFGDKHGDEVGEAVQVAGRDIEVVLRMPMAAQTRYTGPGGVSTTIFHEFGHVATLQSDTDPGRRTLLVPDRSGDSLVEGIAEYCAYVTHPPSWAAPRLTNVRDFLRTGRWEGQAFMIDISGRPALDASAEYGIGYLTIRRLVQRFGLHRTLEFWGRAEHRPFPDPQTASVAVFGVRWNAINTDIARYIHHTVGG